MSVNELKLYKILREKMGEEEAQSLVEYVEAKIEAEFNDKQYVLATKQDLLVLKEELSARMDRQKEELMARMNHQKDELVERMERQKDELVERMERQKEELVERMDRKFESIEQRFNQLNVQVKSDKSDMIKWMFIFWAGQLLAMFALFRFFVGV